jgi:hypothetical protein
LVASPALSDGQRLSWPPMRGSDRWAGRGAEQAPDSVTGFLIYQRQKRI